MTISQGSAPSPPSPRRRRPLAATRSRCRPRRSTARRRWWRLRWWRSSPTSWGRCHRGRASSASRSLSWRRHRGRGPRAAARNACWSATRPRVRAHRDRWAGARRYRCRSASRSAWSSSLRGPAVDVVRVEDDGDQRAPVAGRGRDDRVAGAVGVAGLEAGCARIGAACRPAACGCGSSASAAGRSDRRTRTCAVARPLRDLGHRQRVAGRDRDVVRAHARPALERRLVVEAGRDRRTCCPSCRAGSRSAALAATKPSRLPPAVSAIAYAASLADAIISDADRVARAATADPPAC